MGLFLSLFCFINQILACTAFQLLSEDGASIYCRSMEFEYHMNSEIVVVPRKTKFVCSFSDKLDGMKYQTTYGFIGLNQSLAPTCVNDGMNEKGLVVGCLYLPGFAKYPQPDSKQQARTLSPWELANYILGTCATINEVKEKLKAITVAAIPVPGYKDFVIPLHYWVSDVKGSCIVIEYVDAGIEIHDNPVGVLTNSPNFKWHLTNLSNYCKMQPSAATPLKLGDITAKPFGQGSGLVGLPGDYTPQSRFVKATLFSKFANKMPKAKDAILTGFHILNCFDIFDGIVMDIQKPGAPTLFEQTEWVVVHDSKNRETYIRTYEGQSIQKIDFKKLNFQAKDIAVINLKKTFTVEDISSKTAPLSVK